MSKRQSVSDYEANAGIIPIPLRPDLTVQIAFLPSDLTADEADKIARVVRALANREDGDG